MPSKKVIQAIEEVAKKNKIKIDLKKDLDKSLKSLKIDSLAAINLIMQIEEKLMVTLDDQQLMTIKTLNDLIIAFDKSIK